MTSTISPTSTTAASTQAGRVRNVKNPRSELKAADFINMMVTQLQNQDPTEPTKNEALLAQMSQIGQLQSSQDLQTSLKSLLLQNNLGAAGNMIGKTVEGLDNLGAKSTGTVTSVRVQSGNVVLELDSGKQMELAKLTQIAGSTVPAN